ncbi:MAG: hypothetical protein QGG54_08050 [Gammaproteobacteria bacterium]|jgi:hypothetical protein|nr:hypothetical protein [Gammaproteobacteria bacterium]MDP6535980.1 hypothetical protein [Gammaproteobacteria bacterium]MDP6731493.1 hypothetical protein [Gammaproteobacteria bacterium]|tara:strand:- start:283 stop:561 length:279 start_codon:yes stop_codon:yes gene_type:complete
MTLNKYRFFQSLKLLALVAFTTSLYAQTPNPYRNVDWATLPDGRAGTEEFAEIQTGPALSREWKINLSFKKPQQRSSNETYICFTRKPGAFA